MAHSNDAPRREPVLVLSEAEIRRLVTPDRDALAAIEDAFTRLASGKAGVPPILGLFVPERRGEVDVGCGLGPKSQECSETTDAASACFAVM
jgi:ornithine cyclodeaminase/alanine dehydrogenase-like protein (mu-crystallin family)